jgi:hypothetical protein
MSLTKAPPRLGSLMVCGRCGVTALTGQPLEPREAATTIAALKANVALMLESAIRLSTLLQRINERDLYLDLDQSIELALSRKATDAAEAMTRFANQMAEALDRTSNA